MENSGKHVVRHVNLTQTRIVQECPHCFGPIFASIEYFKHETADDKIGELIFSCQQCSTGWTHGGLVQSRNGYISERRLKYIESDGEYVKPVSELAHALKRAEEYYSTFTHDFAHHELVADLLVERGVTPFTLINNERQLTNLLEDYRVEGHESVFVRTLDDRDFMLYCSDPDGIWYIQRTGDPADWSEGQLQLSQLTFPIRLLAPAITS